METDKNSRLLYLYEMLVHGEGLQKKEAAARFGVNERSIQRDIDCLRNFFASQEPPQEILYKAKEQRYELTSAARELSLLRGAAGGVQNPAGQPLHAEG